MVFVWVLVGFSVLFVKICEGILGFSVVFVRIVLGFSVVFCMGFGRVQFSRVLCGVLH